MRKQYIVSLDQGTTSCRTIIFDSDGKSIKQVSKEFTQIYPKAGWVEHDPLEILDSQLYTFKNAIKESGLNPKDIACIGITNQRETIVIWDRETGLPVYNAIVWQCRRTAQFCDNLKVKGLEDEIYDRTGLVIDPYFSASKLKWILDNNPNLRKKAINGDILAGTIDTWLIWNLTDEKHHFTDYTNASRTMLFNINNLKWDENLLKMFNIPREILPEVKNSSDFYGNLNKSILGKEIPITGVAGDQHAALFGQACFDEGMVKNTYGTGCFILMNTGDERKQSSNKLLNTIAWAIDNKIEYATEGSVFSAGSAVQWLRDELKIINSADETEKIAYSVKDTNGVYFVPAFVGMGAPHWDPYARGSILGITRGTKRAHIVRAVLEAIAFQSKDVIDLMAKESGINIKELRADGGAASNNFLLQFQSDIINLPVVRPLNIETTALGAAYLAGLNIGIWKNKEEIKNTWKEEVIFTPKLSKKDLDSIYMYWEKAISKALNWI